MKNLKSKINRGFTMIELLIVIAVLGVLAIAVLATFNPIEQINRGRDTASRSDAEQILSAIDRYNANRGLWPWQDASDEEDAIGVLTQITTDAPTGGTCTMMENLGTGADPCPGTDEIKQAFIARMTSDRANAINIYYRGESGDSVYICFNPQSKAFSQEAATRCDGGLPADLTDIEGTICGGCPASVGTGDNCACLP